MKPGPVAGLNAGFFVGADHVVIGAQLFPLPDALIKVKNTTGLLGKVRIAWKNPAAILPGSNGVSIEPTPDCGSADGSHNALVHGFPGYVSMTETRKRQALFAWQFTGKGLDLHHDFRGKNDSVSRAVVDPEDRPGVVQKIVCAIY